MFKINQTILYGSHGICKIGDITEQIFRNESKKYYILHPVNNPTSTIYVPVDNKSLTDKMRTLLSESEIYELIKSMPDADSEWIENKNERAEHFRSVLQTADRREIIKLIKTIYIHREQLHSIGKKLNSSDEQFFKEAEKVIYDEFALVLNIKREQVLPFIMNQLVL